MKSHFFKISVLSLLALLFIACEDVIQINLDEGSKLYVIDAFINDLKTEQRIRIVNNDTYFSNREPVAVTGANVILKDLTSNKEFLFNYTSNGYYVLNPLTEKPFALLNHQYELNVTIDGAIYKSLSTQKRTAVIDSIFSIFRDGKNNPFGPKTTYFNCYLIAKDKTDANTDYYWIKTYRNDTLFNGSRDLNLCIDGTGGPINGATVDSTVFTPPGVFLGFKRYQINDVCKVEIHSISRETYFLLNQAVDQINNGGLFATTPENIKTNILTPKDAKIKAIGWFNVASVTTKTKVVK